MPKRISLAVLIISAVPLVVSLAGCAGANDSVSNSTDLQAERPLLLDRIASDCRLPRTALVLSSANELHFQPPPDANYESVDCALRRLRQEELTKNMPIGVVGNERFEANDAAPD